MPRRRAPTPIETVLHTAYWPKGYIPRRDVDAFKKRHADRLVTVLSGIFKGKHYVERLDAYEASDADLRKLIER